MDASRYALASWSAEPARFFVQYYSNLEQTRFRLTGTAGAGATAIAIGYFPALFPSSLLRLGFDSDMCQSRNMVYLSFANLSLSRMGERGRKSMPGPTVLFFLRTALKQYWRFIRRTRSNLFGDCALYVDTLLRQSRLCKSWR